MTTPTRKRSQQPSSCPDRHLPAGHIVPLRLTVKQVAYCRRAVGIARFVYNLCVATHRFCRTNRLPWPSWQDLNLEFNACKHELFPFVAEVSYRVAEGAIRDFGTAVANWRDPAHKGPASHVQEETPHRHRLVPRRRWRTRYPLQRQAPHQAALPRLRQTRPYAASGHHLRSAHLVSQRPVAAVHQLLEATGGQTEARHPHRERRRRHRHQPVSHRLRRHNVAKPQGLLPSRTQTRSLATCPSPPHPRLPRLVGSPATHRPTAPQDRRHAEERPAHNDEHPRPQVSEHRHRRPQCGRHDARQYPQSPSRRRHGRDQTADHLQRAVATLRDIPRPPVLSIQQDVLQLRFRERETQTEESKERTFESALVIPLRKYRKKTKTTPTRRKTRAV